MSEVREINDPAELAHLRLVWNSLLPLTPGASFFHSLDWLLTYWNHFGEQARLRVLVVTSLGRPVGILPLAVRRVRRRLGTFRVLTYPLDDWGSFYGPIGPSPTATLIAGLAHIRRTPRDWDLIELPWVDALGTDRGRTPAAMAQMDFPALAEPWQTSALIELCAYGDWNTYWASRTSRWRNNVRRNEKKLAQRGVIEHVRYRPSGSASGDDDPRWDWYEACERIALSSWQGTSTTGTTLSHDAVRAFLRDCHRVAAKAGALDLNLLLLDGEPVAFNYAYQYQGNVFGLRTGFAPQADADGAGSVLQARMIEDCFARDDWRYDLGPGYLACKRYWHTEVRRSYRYSHFPITVPRAQLVRLKRGWQQLWRRENRPAAIASV